MIFANIFCIIFFSKYWQLCLAILQSNNHNNGFVKIVNVFFENQCFPMFSSSELSSSDLCVVNFLNCTYMHVEHVEILKPIEEPDTDSVF
jgi:hypothetical protein